MKKYFVIIGLISLMTIQAQNYNYVVTNDVTTSNFWLYATSDTTFYDTKPGENWFGRYGTIDVYVRNMEALTLKIYPGGYDRLISNTMDVQDFTYFDDIANIPLTIDTTAGILVKHNGWWHYKFSKRNFPCKLPGVELVWSTTDSCEVYILFNAGQL